MNVSLVEITGSRVEIFKLNKQLDDLYKTKNIKIICIDATKCDYMNSYTLGLVIYYYSLMMKQNRKIVMMLSQDKKNYMNRLFKATKLEKLFEVVKNLDEIKPIY